MQGNLDKIANNIKSPLATLEGVDFGRRIAFLRNRYGISTARARLALNIMESQRPEKWERRL